MLRTRLWMGGVLIALTAGALVLDGKWRPWFPIWFGFLLLLALAATVEMRRLVPESRRPAAWLCLASVTALLGANWTRALGEKDPWRWIALVFGAVVMAAFLVEMMRFRPPLSPPYQGGAGGGESINRLSIAVALAAYLGLLPCFLAQLRWSGGETETGDLVGTARVVLAVFVPKCCDIGAYSIGRIMGRHPMAPILSPKKTWEGAAGGLLASVLATVALDRFGPALVLGDWARRIGFGLTVGGFAMLGDLAESLLKRDSRQKDASQAVPGFGGVLDVVDSVIFAAPVAYCWLIHD